MRSNNSTDKLGIESITKPDGAKWISVSLLKWGRPGQRPTWIPSFLDLHRIIQAICQCEDEKYPPPAYAGRAKVAAFLKAAVYEADFRMIAQQFQIPERDGDRVIRTNGARIPGFDPVRDMDPDDYVNDHVLWDRGCKHKPEFFVNGRCSICERMTRRDRETPAGSRR